MGEHHRERAGQARILHARRTAGRWEGASGRDNAGAARTERCPHGSMSRNHGAGRPCYFALGGSFRNTTPDRHATGSLIPSCENSTVVPATPGYWERRSRASVPAPSFPSSGPRGAPRPSRVKIGQRRSVSGRYFQTSPRRSKALHWGQDGQPRRSCGANVDSLHICARSALGGLPAQCSVRRVERRVCERQRVHARRESCFAALNPAVSRHGRDRPARRLAGEMASSARARAARHCGGYVRAHAPGAS